MLRRPLTCLELGDDDLRWMMDELEKKRKSLPKYQQQQQEEAEEPMEVEKKEEEDRVFAQISTPVPKITGGPALDDLMTYDPPRSRNLPAATTPQAVPQPDMVTPVNSEAFSAPPPNIRVTRANARQSRISTNAIHQPIFQTPEAASTSSTSNVSLNGSVTNGVRLQMLPETPEGIMNDISPTLRSIESSPTQDLLATLLSPGGPSANTRRSQRH
ncbi:unnamed protein product [Caenorhabditis angaria]|uniref:Uncharacterized protein n=1 Tax=Caenorhabditis angaria TaxID=860376 RepID=A0A9P1I687_9PELO|nr:unnamed protein product [Caenorhabditis angaria]